MQVFRLNSKLDKMQNLFVFGEINKYLDTQIIEIEAQPFWNPGNQSNRVLSKDTEKQPDDKN